jgi:predicted transposase/invertase (TIGR01784 family)
MPARKLISFDWALKRLLRSKANFGILEGFLSELLHDDIRILEVLESESNKDDPADRSNRIDIKVRNQRGELVIIEIQYEREHDYLSRMLYGTSRARVEHIQEGQAYGSLIKVISVNILYFDLGHGSDYIYHGTTRFHGLHKHDELALSKAQRQLFPGRTATHELFPEHYLIKVNQFDDVARNTLDEWVYFLKHEEIKDGFSAKGLHEAKDKLDVLKLPPAERAAYERWQEDLHLQASLVWSNYGLGKLEGREEGLAEGLEAGRQEGHEAGAAAQALAIARNLKAEGLDPDAIARLTGLAVERIRGL